MKKLLLILLFFVTMTATAQLVESNGNVGIGTYDPVAKLHIDNSGEDTTEIMRTTNDGHVYFHWVQRPDSTKGLCWFSGTYIALGNEYGNQDPQLRIVHRPQDGFTIFNARSYSEPTLKHGLRFAASGQIWIWTTNSDDIWMRGGAVKFLGDLRLLGWTESDAAPSTTELPNHKDCSIHRDTSSGSLSLAINDNGIIKTIGFY